MDIEINAPQSLSVSIGSSGSSGAVQSVNGKTGVVVLTATDVGALPSSTTIPTKTSELTNDSGFLTSHQSLAAYSTTEQMNTAINNHHDSTKQDTLTAGSNITINNNTISATDTTYSAGTGISISNNVISATGSSSSNVEIVTQSNTYAELLAKYNAGKFLILQKDSYYYPLQWYLNSGFMFGLQHNKTTKTYYINDLNIWSEGTGITNDNRLITDSTAFQTAWANAGYGSTLVYHNDTYDLDFFSYRKIEGPSGYSNLDTIYFYAPDALLSGGGKMSFFEWSRDGVTPSHSTYTEYLLVPQPNTSGTYVLKSVAGTLTWVLES